MLIYLSCHGVLDDSGRLYYAATNTRRQREAATAVAAAWLNERLEDCRARHQIVLLDCCYSGAFARSAKGEADLALQQRFQSRGRGRVVLTASRSTEYSFEGNQVSGEGVQSVFTHAIVDGLRTGDADRDKDGLITVNDLYRHVYDEVRSVESRQTPELWLYAGEGEFVVAHSIRGAVIEPVSLPEDLRVTLESGRYRVRETGVAELAELLDTAEPGLALTARQALRRIADKDNPRVAAVARAALGSSQGMAADRVSRERGRQDEQERREAREEAKRQAEEQARREAQEEAKRQAEEQARREAREKAKRQAEENARREAEYQTERTRSAGLDIGAGAPAGAAGLAAARWEASRRALKGWRVRWGLLLLIIIPTLTAVALGGIRIASSLHSARVYQQVQTLASLGQQITVLAQALQDERDQTVFYIALGKLGGRADLSTSSAVRPIAALELRSVIEPAFNSTDSAASQVRAMAGRIGSAYTVQTQQETATVLTALGELKDLRNASINTQLPALVVVQKYTQVIDDVLVLNNEIAQGVGDPALAQTVRVLALVSSMKEEASEQRAILAAALLQGSFGPSQLAALEAAQSAQQSNLTAFDNSATVGQRLTWNRSVDQSFVYLASSEELQAISLQNSVGSLGGDPTTAVDWFGAMSNTVDFQMGSVESGLAATVKTRAAMLSQGAITSEVAVSLVLVVLVLLFMVVLGPSMIRLWRRGHQVPRNGVRIQGLFWRRPKGAALNEIIGSGRSVI